LLPERQLCKTQKKHTWKQKPFEKRQNVHTILAKYIIITM